MRSRFSVLLTIFVLTSCTDRVPTAPEGDDPRFSPSQLASFTTVTVNSMADPGDGTCDTSECTLREAIAAVAPGGSITFQPGLSGAITLAPSAGQLAIEKALTIVGPGSAVLAIRGNRDARVPGRVLFVNAAGAEVSIENLAFTKGYIDGPGGCIQNEGTALLLSRVVVADCEAFGAGGGVASTGMNAHRGHLTLVDVTVRNNWAADGGGGIYNNFSSILHVTGSTVSSNEGRDGGGIGSTGMATIVNTTISGNRSRGRAGGLDVQNSAMTVAHSTIVHNASDVDEQGGDGHGGGVFFYGDHGSLTLSHTIIANNSNGSGSGPDCASSAGRLPITSAGYNLVGDDTNCLQSGAQMGDIVDVDVLLGPLADNGGVSHTHMPLPGSPAVDAGDPAFSPPPVWDQRGAGFPRVQNEHIDIGAVETFYFPFVGFLPPVANPPALNLVQAGQTVPVKFSLGGWEGLAIFAPGYPMSESVACASSTQSTGISTTALDVASRLTYDAETESYNYLWRTDRDWAGTCRRLTLKFTDGAEYSADFQFR